MRLITNLIQTARENIVDRMRPLQTEKHMDAQNQQPGQLSDMSLDDGENYTPPVSETNNDAAAKRARIFKFLSYMDSLQV